MPDTKFFDCRVSDIKLLIDEVSILKTFSQLYDTATSKTTK